MSLKAKPNLKKPLVSIITPSFNQGKYIEETIKSVLAQDYDNIEYIVVDGGSTDNTLDILNKYKDKLTFISEPDKGQSHAINKGFKMAKGEILAWLNSDDMYIEGAVSKAVGYLIKHPDVVMVYGEGYHTFENGEIMERYYTESFNYRRLADICFICQPTVFMRAKTLRSVGMIDETLNYSMDYELWIRIGKRNKIGYLNDFLAKSRLHEENKTLSMKGEVHEEVFKIVKMHYGKVPMSWVYGYVDYLVSKKYTQRGLKNKISKWFVQRFLLAYVYLRENQYNGKLSSFKFIFKKLFYFIKALFSLIFIAIYRIIQIMYGYLRHFFHFILHKLWIVLPLKTRQQLKGFIKREAINEKRA